MIDEKSSAAANLSFKIEAELKAIKELPASLLQKAFAGENPKGEPNDRR